jgi:hypothetical protein
MKTQKAKAPKTIHDLTVEMLTSGPQSIRSISNEWLRLTLASYPPGTDPVDLLAEFWSAAEAALHDLDCVPDLDTADKGRAYLNKRIEGCFDSWPDGPDAGHEIYDAILWHLPVALPAAVAP